MKQYEYVELILKEDFKGEFTQTDLLKYIRENKRIDIDQTYISKLLKSLVDKEIIKLTRVENKERGFFAKKYYRLSNLEKWDNIFK